MVFSSLFFLFVFLPVVVITYFASPGIKIRNIILLAASLVFYSWGEPIWVGLMLFSGLLDYTVGLLIEKYRHKRYVGRIGLACSLSINLLLLATFKYADFIINNVNFVFGSSFTPPGIMLPLGISFYTFQTMSYTIDVFRGSVIPEKNFMRFLMYVSLFPQLVAGPIVRYSEIAPVLTNRPPRWAQISSGVNRFVLGLFKKVALANSLGVLVEKYLTLQLHELSSIEACYGIILFSAQLFFDFSGYSDMAIGLGRIFGFDFPENFRNPYASKSISEFYNRWHMTLGRFFKDYLYFPLGGGRNNKIRNILIVWFCTGLWHGASWNFVIWGLFLGFFVVVETLLKKYFDLLPRFILYIYAFIIIHISRSIFFYDDLQNFKIYLRQLFSSSFYPSEVFSSDLISYCFLYFTAILFCIPWNEIFTPESRTYGFFNNLYHQFSLPINLLLLFICSVLLVDASYNPFIYFRF